MPMQTRKSILCAIVVAASLACGGGGPPETSGGPCQVLYSKNWEYTVSDFSAPRELSHCKLPLYQADTFRVSGGITFRFNTNENGNSGGESNYYRIWTKNTAYTQNGTARGDTLQNSGIWFVDTGYVESGKYYEEIELPLQFVTNWPVVTNLIERDSISIYYLSRISRSSGSKPFGNYAGEFLAVSSVKRDTLPALISGPAGVDAGTGGFGYNWYVDGTPIPENNDLKTLYATLSTAGTHTIRVDQLLLDTTFIVTKSVEVPITTSVDGPAIVQSGTSNQYSAGLAHGTAPYTYVWTIDASYYGTGSSIYAPAWSAYTDHWITVTGTDANGATGYAEKSVYANQGCDPEDPGCQPELRSAPAEAKRPVTPARKPPEGRLGRP
jgi:hypothetical protein